MSVRRVFLSSVMLGLAMLVATLTVVVPVLAGWHSPTGMLPVHAGIYRMKISPDSSHVLFLSDMEVLDRLELYSVPITGTMPTKLNPTLVADGEVYNFAVTPDSQYVIYTAKQEKGESRADLYRVPIDGGTAVKLNVAFLSGRNVREAVIDPDNVRVIYDANQLNDDVSELFSVPIAGGIVVKLNPTPLVTGGDVYGGFTVDPIGNRVLYLADQEVNNRVELYGVPIAGGMAVNLNPLGSQTLDYVRSPQSQVVVFRAKPSGSNIINLYMNSTAGGSLVPLNIPLDPDQNVVGFRISADGARVVYNVATGFSQDGDLYSVPVNGGASIPLTTADAGYGVPHDSFDVTADGQRVVYAYRKNAATSRVLESVSINGDHRTTLYNTGAGEGFNNLVLSPDGRWVVYNTYPSVQAYSIETAGGTSIPLGVAIYPRITPDSSRVLFYSPKSSKGYDIFNEQISGGDVRNLSRLGDQVDIMDSIISPDSRWSVFILRYKTDRWELRVSDGFEVEPTPTPTTPPTPTPTVFKVYVPIILDQP